MILAIYEISCCFGFLWSLYENMLNPGYIKYFPKDIFITMKKYYSILTFTTKYLPFHITTTNFRVTLPMSQAHIRQT